MFRSFRVYLIRLSSAAYAAQISAVASVDALSEMTSSKSARVWLRMESRVEASYFSPL